MQKQKDLCFIDIEATDIEPFEILQFSAFICDPNTFEIKETINQKFKSNVKPRERIKKLLKINEWVPNYETLQTINYEWAKRIKILISNYVVISYGDFDKKIIAELFNKYEIDIDLNQMIDYFEIFKTKWPIRKITPSLFKTCLLLGIDIDFHKMHDALYDTWMLLQVYKATNHKLKEEFINLVEPLEFMPKIGESKNFFYDFKTNVNKNYFIFIEELNIGLEKDKNHIILSAKFFDLEKEKTFNYKKFKKHFFISSLDIKKDIFKYKDDLNNLAFLLQKSNIIAMGEIGSGRITSLLNLIKKWTKKEVTFKFIKITKINKNMKSKAILKRIDIALEVIKAVRSKPLNDFSAEFNYFIEKFKGQINEGNKN